MKTLAALLLLSFLCTVQVASACTCAQKEFTKEKDEHYKQWVERHDVVVFAGRVVSVRPTHQLYKDTNLNVKVPAGYGFPTADVTFAVEEIWKGTKSAEVKVRTGRGGGDCGIGFVVGSRYFVEAATTKGWGADLWTWACGPTMVLSGAGKYVEQLGPGAKPAHGEAPPEPGAKHNNRLQPTPR